MPATTTQTVSCSCCTPQCAGCPFRDPMPCSLHVLMSGTGTMAIYNGCPGLAQKLTPSAPTWQFNGLATACNGGTNPCGSTPPGWTSRFYCGALGGTPCLTWGSAPDASIETIGDCFTNYALDGSTGQTLTSVSYNPFHQVLVQDFGGGNTLTLDITE